MLSCSILTSFICCSAQGSSPNGHLSIVDENGDDQDAEDDGGGIHPNGNGISEEHVDNGDIDTESLRPAEGTDQGEADASSLIKLDNGDVLYMREVNR